MHLSSEGDLLRVQVPLELNASNASPFRDFVRGALRDEHQRVDLDFSRTTFLDSSGLGALVALHKALAARRGTIRILAARPEVRRVLELTHMHRLFDMAADAATHAA